MLRLRLGVQTMGTHVWRSAGLQRRGVATGDLKEAMKAMRNKSRRRKKRRPPPRPRYIPLQEPSREVKEDDLYTLRHMGIHHTSGDTAGDAKDPFQNPLQDPLQDPFQHGQDHNQDQGDASFDPIQPTNPVRPFSFLFPFPFHSLSPPHPTPTPPHLTHRPTDH